jgi:hypothetical protein
MPRALDLPPEDGHRMPGEGRVGAALQGGDALVGRLGGDGGEVVLALLRGADAEWVPAHGGGADPAEVAFEDTVRRGRASGL